MSRRDSPKEGLNIVHKIVPIAVEEERVEMSDYVKKALESTDISVIEKAIGMEEGRVSKYVDQIHAVLKIDDENGPYYDKSISKIELCEAENGLREAFGKVEYLLDWLHLQLLSRAEDSYAEESRIEKEVNIDRKVQSGL